MYRSNSNPALRAAKPSSIGALVLAALATVAVPAVIHGDQAPSFAVADKVGADDGGSGDSFGYSVSIDSARMVVGAIGESPSGTSSGAAYVFECCFFGSWFQVAKIVADDGAAFDQFGRAVGLSGDRIVVGAPENDEAAANAGAAYVFGRDIGGAGNWGLITKITVDDAAVGERLGTSVAIDGETAIVGAPDTGTAYVHERDAGGPSNWGLVAEVNSPGADSLGFSVAIEGDWAIVGAPAEQEAHVRNRNEGGADNWGEVAELSGLQGFGYSVGISGETAVVGVYLANDMEGTADVFERDFGGPDNWGRVAELSAADANELDLFGFAVAIDGDTVAVGAYLDDDNGTSSGSVYAFQRDQGGVDNWGKVAKSIAPEGEAFDYFGWSLSLSAGQLAIGAYLDDDNGNGAGGAYVYEEIVVDPALVVTGNCPGEVTFNFTGGTPLGQAALAFSQEAGNAVIPGGLCAGTETGLDVVNPLGILPTDASGEISLDATVPFFVCDLQLQVVDLVSCATSNVTTLP